MPNIHVFLTSVLYGGGDSCRFSLVSLEEIDFDTCKLEVWLNPGNNLDLVLHRQESPTGHTDHSELNGCISIPSSLPPTRPSSLPPSLPSLPSFLPSFLPSHSFTYVFNPLTIQHRYLDSPW